MTLRTLSFITVSAALAVAGDSRSQAVTASNPSYIRLGGGIISAGYSHSYGYRPWAFDPFYYGLYSSYYPGFFTGFSRGPDMGEIRLRASSPKDGVYLNGAYAGEAGHLKNIWLEPGAYNLEVKPDNQVPFSRRVYVLSGKILKIDAEAKP
ncbi:MAG: PEGA domain-containing protein [Acidobacteriota bacterium]|nr:PEGA domain-containing protein [Acidobacteriota bacterium]